MAAAGSRLEGDTLFVSPATFAAMQEQVAGSRDPDAAAIAALRVAGLTDAEIKARLGRETRVEVVWSGQLRTAQT